MSFDPAVVNIYAPSKSGKTCETLYSFPRGLFIADRGALGSAISVCGYQPDDRQILRARTIKDAEAVIRAIESKKYDAVVIDDFSIMAEYSVADIQTRMKNWDVWQALRRQVFNIRDAARAQDLHVIIVLHEVAPEVKDGRFYKGGPKLPIRGASAELPALADLVMRVGRDDSRIGMWKGVFECRPNDPNWIMGGRLVDVTMQKLPMNTREILNSLGCFGVIGRLAELSWQEDAVEKISEKLVSTEYAEWPRFITACTAQLGRKCSNPLHVRWTLRDGLDRAEMKILRRDAATRFFEASNAVVSQAASASGSGDDII